MLVQCPSPPAGALIGDLLLSEKAKDYLKFNFLEASELTVVDWNLFVCVRPDDRRC